ncbi:MAG: TIGR00282 family metallophosphoesterase [Candidatus Omnitrophica bacterium]|nr:TIGR00282 family metallophosphoesterase [Candidatus Omnitrophota bacterium]
MRLLFLGDIVGSPGREIISRKLGTFRKERQIDLVAANGENAAGGSGLTPRICNSLIESGVDIITSGDHIWKKREIYDYLDSTDRLIRPANYPAGAPGKGYTVIKTASGTLVGVINVIGRVFMDAVDCSFTKVRDIVKEVRRRTPVILVDIHAEATSEKVAMGWFLDGKVSAVVGTHTHVQTADEKILPEGTAYITDCGMTGPHLSVIGRSRGPIIERFLTQLPTRFEVASEGLEMHGVLIDIDEGTGKALKIERVQEKL